MVLSLVLFAATASAHFLIGSPIARPFDDDGEAIGPCGGQPLGSRTHFPITGGVISGGLYHPTGTANFSIVISNTDPTASQFGVVPIGPGFNVKLTEGPFSTDPIDLSKIPSAVDGANATIQTVISTVDGVLYVCSDVVLDKSISKNAASSPLPTEAAPSAFTTATKGAAATSTTKSGAFANAVAAGFVALVVALIMQ
ncbi:UNVERIFIED_CONTAM: hypothetical protein HDU68_010631 [Siphonaria sp. JEL0065]|nr:hypothetical protein HDU68_010631 [Siphonaria sp. JEL0065]